MSGVVRIMSSLSLRLRYRPIRIGWCVREGNFDDIERALRLTHTLWGGRYNPLIPVDNQRLATQLVDVFRVDALFPVCDDQHVQEFAKGFSHLPWPLLHKELFVEGGRGKLPTLIDVWHAANLISADISSKKANLPHNAAFWEWADNDSLKYVFLASFGSYPDPAEIGIDYKATIATRIKWKLFSIGAGDAVHRAAYELLTPSSISSYALYWDRVPAQLHRGFYVGNSGDFPDILNFWNLRAAGMELAFYDLSYEARLRDLRDAYRTVLDQHMASYEGWENFVAVWTKSPDLDVREFGAHVIQNLLTEEFWNGLNVTPVLVYWTERPVLASVSDSYGRQTASFLLPEKPVADEIEFHTQHLVASIGSPFVEGDSSSTFWTPYVPELNEYYHREIHLGLNGIRAEVQGIGVVISATDSDLNIRALNRQQVIAKLFETFGMKAEPSQAGKIATRLIEQLGGFQGCRVFKIAGVRRLIEKYGPLEWFGRTEATGIIGQRNTETGTPCFDAYEQLYIEPREGGKLKPEDALIYLLKKGVFRAGMVLRCLSCELEFWLFLDAVATEVPCEYCGTRFNVTPQLRDRDWAYRRSGLFGKEDNQEGAIPVALTLQQLDTTIHRRKIAVTAMNLTPVSADINACETDFVLLAEGSRTHKVDLAVGECKSSGGGITQDDVVNLTKVADALPAHRIQSFIVFSKTAPFTAEEVERCRAAQHPQRRRVILLSDRELEPYFVYERTQQEFVIEETAISFQDLADRTHDIYFEPKRRHRSD